MHTVEWSKEVALSGPPLEALYEKGGFAQRGFVTMISRKRALNRCEWDKVRVKDWDICCLYSLGCKKNAQNLCTSNFGTSESSLPKIVWKLWAKKIVGPQLLHKVCEKKWGLTRKFCAMDPWLRLGVSWAQFLHNFSAKGQRCLRSRKIPLGSVSCPGSRKTKASAGVSERSRPTRLWVCKSKNHRLLLDSRGSFLTFLGGSAGTPRRLPWRLPRRLFFFCPGRRDPKTNRDTKGNCIAMLSKVWQLGFGEISHWFENRQSFMGVRQRSIFAFWATISPYDAYSTPLARSELSHAKLEKAVAVFGAFSGSRGKLQESRGK